jgi:hypothetical protein
MRFLFNGYLEALIFGCQSTWARVSANRPFGSAIDAFIIVRFSSYSILMSFRKILETVP